LVSVAQEERRKAIKIDNRQEIPRDFIILSLGNNKNMKSSEPRQGTAALLN
jgi:hypothetical protein